MINEYMNLALLEAKKALKENEVPVGAIIVKDGEVIASAHNTKNKDKDVLGHAEINVIKKAQEILKTTILDNCELYITLEPCLMCTGAIVSSRIKRVYYAAKEPKFGAHTSKYQILANDAYNHNIEVYDGFLEEESSKLLKEFFKEKR